MINDIDRRAPLPERLRQIQRAIANARIERRICQSQLEVIDLRIEVLTDSAQACERALSAQEKSASRRGRPARR